ncbi:HAMP domain-containing sensor histidine kinase [Piscinibacter sp. HJYY11]|uniref:sensor histidine kinase n=1 Tax=Piscinibacter sp. HJYY11 TaxID=2801333 RepID=UPI0019201C74|nr:PAS domain-containing sensor histidine kinase [Piscinibacter sp. HJYY11]MBL0729003.1 PAS domain-containing sensor histidine kinase [Piscinibacter sp. HJYY11]
MKPDASVLGRKRWLVVVGPLLAVVLLLAALTVASIDLLSSARAYVGGESFWSKGQKDAVYHLERYIATRDPAEYRLFEEALKVPLGDRRARLALEQRPPDREAARLGFLAGGNHPDDVEGMINLFVRFRRVSFMAAAIDTWAEGDQQIAQLATLGRQVQEHIASGDTRSPELAALTAELPRLNQRLTDLEGRFSTTLGEASRTVSRLMLGLTLVLAIVLSAGALLLTRSLMRAQARAEEELRLANERWTLAADAAGIGLFDWDLQTRQARIDARGAAVYGLPPEPVELEGSKLTLPRIHPDDAQQFRATLAQIMNSHTPTTTRYRVRLDDGSERHVEAVAMVRHGHGRASGARMIGTLRDVTREVLAAQALLDKEAAERGNRSKSEFLSRVSHELRTPLNAVLGFSELLQTDPREPLSPTQAARVQHVIDAGRHLLALIDDVLDLSESDEAAVARLPLQPVLLGAAVQVSVDRLRPMAERQQVQVQAELPEHPVYVLADPRRLSQVLAHLLSNAIKFNRRGGDVKVSCEPLGEEVRIRVHDTGHGLRADQLAQLFQPFNRLGAESTRAPGSGLGLVVVQQLLRRQRGRIALTSTAGIGTCVEVHLQAAQAPAA